MDSGKKKKRFSKRSIKKCMNGAISVLLCLLLTPFLSVTLSLIEYARYQQIMEIADELIELTGMFAIADYDEYIHSRFGFLAVSQENALGDGLDTVLAENAKITGNQLVASNVTVSGRLDLKETEVLKKQLVDFSEYTSTAAVVFEDLRVDELLEKLKSLQSFSNVTDTIDQIATATEKITEVVEAVEQVKKDLEGLQASINFAVTAVADLVDQFTSLVQELGENGITLPEGATVDQIQGAVEQFQNTYLSDIQEIYESAKGLQDLLKEIQSKASTLYENVKKVPGAVEEAADAIEKIGEKTNDAEKDDPKISNEAVTTLNSILKQMETLVNTTLSEIKEESIKTIQDAAQKIIDTVLNESGLSSVGIAGERYNQIVSGEYFKIDDEKLTVSDEARADIEKFLKMAYGVYNDATASGDIGQSIRKHFEACFALKVDLKISLIMGQVDQFLSVAGKTLKNSAGDKFGELIEKLGNLATKIFELHVTSNPKLDAAVSLGNPDTNGNQDFVDAVNALIQAANDFKNSITGFNFVGALKAVWDLFKAIGKMFAAIFEKVKNIIQGIAELTGGLNAVYSRLIISGYMRHSLPCRLDAGDIEGGKVKLSGTSLSGFPYDDIARGENTFKGAELEYVYSGTNEESANQTLAFWDIYFLRLLINLPTVFMDDEVASLAAVANIASWVVYLLYIIIEPFLDTLLLVNDQKLPLVKKNCWVTVSGIGDFTGKLMDAATECEDLKDMAEGLVDDFTSDMGGSGDDGGDDGDPLEMGYRDYILIMLAITVGTDKQVQRLGNLIDLETTRYYENNGKTFDIQKTYTVLDVSADMAFNPFFDLGLFSGSPSHMTRTVSY